MGRKCGIEWFLKEEHDEDEEKKAKKVSKEMQRGLCFAESEYPGDLRK